MIKVVLSFIHHCGTLTSALNSSLWHSALIILISSFRLRFSFGAWARLFAEGGGLRALGLLRHASEGEAARG